MTQRTGAGARTGGQALGRWTATAAHVRALALAAVALGAAVWTRRSDLVVLGAPLLAVAVWGQLTRPRSVPVARVIMADTTLREGQREAVTATATGIDPGCDVVMTMSDADLMERTPRSGVITTQAAPDATARADFEVRTLRWGARPTGSVGVAASSPWHAYRVGPLDLPPLRTVTVPLPAIFETRAPAPHPHGVVGINRSARRGSGTEFATIRPFSPGDRLRRIHWPTTLRTGQAHATSTYAEQDAHIVLLVDAFSDLGTRAGIDAPPTSLDQTVRAAGAIAEHFLSRGERLTLRTVGAAGVPRLPTGTGVRHLRLVLANLAHIAPATERHDDGERAISHLDPHALCLVLTPLVDQRIVEITSVLASRGLTTVVVDCFPEHLLRAESDPYAALAWRLRLLERENEVVMLRRCGVPVVPWRGPGSLDSVLRDISRQAATPKAVRR